MSILSRLWLQVAHTGHQVRMPEPEDGPIAPGIFEDDFDFMAREATARRHENLTGDMKGKPDAAEQPERKAKKARQHHRKSLLKERARLQREVKRLERKRP